MLTTIDRSKLALCPLCSMPAIMENPYVREDALWIRCKSCGFHACVFKDEATAIAAGYRPCAVCMKEEYKRWKEKQKQAAKEKAQT